MRTLILTFAALAAPAAAQVTPGQWKITAAVTEAEMPGVPAMVMGMIKKPRTITQCVTPEQAKQGPQEMMKRDKSCRFTRYSMTGGKLDAEMVCTQPGGGTLTAVSRGTYTADSFQSVADMVGTGAHPMKMTVATSGKLAGECK
ncbi:DUF3617 domain-containing protein [Sphingomonas jatrophae]|uniref:DUF3617 family protein n=1 Tax=Sphingomonas jatrophae TaxID=1166337 RepID=A0A1I6K4T0_9SPHN|nr:DUF3617 domain-containing protein [Sphingomonas jatrophae]SFR86251.1 Protein of unknown function [Sphingomonas jatrophae]